MAVVQQQGLGDDPHQPRPRRPRPAGRAERSTARRSAAGRAAGRARSRAVEPARRVDEGVVPPRANVVEGRGDAFAQPLDVGLGAEGVGQHLGLRPRAGGRGAAAGSRRPWSRRPARRSIASALSVWLDAVGDQARRRGEQLLALGEPVFSSVRPVATRRTDMPCASPTSG